MTTNIDPDTVDRIRRRYTGAVIPAGTPLADALERYGIPHRTRGHVPRIARPAALLTVADAMRALALPLDRWALTGPLADQLRITAFGIVSHNDGPGPVRLDPANLTGAQDLTDPATFTAHSDPSGPELWSTAQEVTTDDVARWAQLYQQRPTPDTRPPTVAEITAGHGLTGADVVFDPPYVDPITPADFLDRVREAAGSRFGPPPATSADVVRAHQQPVLDEVTRRRVLAGRVTPGRALSSSLFAAVVEDARRTAEAAQHNRLAATALHARATTLERHGRAGHPNTASSAMLGHFPADLIPACLGCGRLVNHRDQHPHGRDDYGTQANPIDLDDRAGDPHGDAVHAARARGIVWIRRGSITIGVDWRMFDPAHHDDQVDALRHATLIIDDPPRPARYRDFAEPGWSAAVLELPDRGRPHDPEAVFRAGINSDRCAPLPDDVDEGGTRLDTGKVGMPGARELCPAPLDHCLAVHDHGDMGAGWRP